MKRETKENGRNIGLIVPRSEKEIRMMKGNMTKEIKKANKGNEQMEAILFREIIIK
jgi:hypothetical protein